MKKLAGILAMVLLLSGCSSTTKEVSKHDDQMFDVGFDTVVQLVAYTESDKEYETYKNKMRELFIYYNQLFDPYNDYEGVNNLKTINDNAGIAPVEVDQHMIDILKLARTYGEQSGNQYNVTMGAVMEVWHNYRDEALNGGEAKLPSMEELQSASILSGWDNVDIDETKKTVYLTQKGIRLDLGSVAKGYATELIAQELEKEGLTSAIINAGGNVRIIGEKPEGKAWTVGVQLPDPTKDASLATVSIHGNKSFVTSGDYQRAYEVDGKMYHHVIDPHTLFPSTFMRAVTVVTDDSGIADMLSTTLFTMSYEDGSALLNTLRTQGMDVEAVWVFDDTNTIPENVDIQKSGSYSLIISDGLKDNIKVKP